MSLFKRYLKPRWKFETDTRSENIRFTVKTKNDNTIPFLDTLVIKDSEGRLTTRVYRKPTHTGQYLCYGSHHPQSVKRGVITCLYDPLRFCWKRKKNLLWRIGMAFDSKMIGNTYFKQFSLPNSPLLTRTKSSNFFFLTDVDVDIVIQFWQPCFSRIFTLHFI